METPPVPAYLVLLLDLFSAILAQDHARLEEVHDAITEYGWNRGPSMATSIATSNAITLIHEGGLRAGFPAEWVAEWQRRVEDTHGAWVTVPPNLVQSVLLIACGDKDTITSTAQSTRCVGQALFISTVAVEKYGEDIETALHFALSMLSFSVLTIRRMAEKEPLGFEP
jgi:hypothetical protein